MTTPIDWTPFIFGAIPAVLALLGILVNNVFGAWNRRRNATETKAPNVVDAWKAADAARDESTADRARAQLFQDAYYALRDVTRAVIRRIRRGDPLSLGPDEENLIFHTDPATPKQPN